ncbi:Sel1 domain-containing protein repeat-containing protein [Methylorubrum populi]|uniref:Sel1 domain-containing protein repeat-containing protein n=1 Tax=Methylorubrum populi TaxID=223967 RepID=A0A160PHG1_9HYPH|nr:SEL1-like repeat protein [Methylorubrum populi]BAU92175.1 Sel1 domain-containing protein repeat-containing protein [Methylorubrum populi]
MKQSAPISLDSFDPEVLAAAREVARRAGVPLESWIASVAAPETSKPGPRRRRADASSPAKEAGTDQARQVGGRAADKAAAPRKEALQHKRRDASVAGPASEDPAAPSPTASLEASIGAMMRRLDALDRSISEEREASKADAARMIGDVERKVGELAGQLSAPRPLGRRGRPLATEVRDAVAEVRRRQRELEEGIAEWNAAGAAGSQRRGPEISEMGVLAAGLQADTGHGEEPSLAIAELQRETSRLRDVLGGLATGRDVGELEQTMQAVAGDLRRARDPQEIAAIAAPIELMRVQVDRLAGDVADNVHARIAGDVERVSAKVDDVLSGTLPGPADQNALDGVFRELDEIRRLVAALAGPERIQSLAQGVQALSAQIAQLQRDEDAGIAAIKPLLEEIRGELRTSDPARALPHELLGRFEALAERLGHAEGGPVGELIERLEAVAEKVDRVSAGGSGLDALERHVVALASRLDAPRDTDPAVARLERAMGDLLSQVAALRSGADVESAVERAVREAVAGSATPPAAAGGEVALLRADLAELRASQKGSDQRLQSTMEGVQTVLTRLSEQLDRTMTSSAALTVGAPQERALRGPSPSERPAQEKLSQERPAAPKAAAAAPARPRPAAPSEEAGGMEASRLSDELLEPGAGRPAPGRPAMPEAGPTVGSTDIKTSFIAAARRAAQAAQVEAAAEAPLAARLRDKVTPAARAPGTETAPLSRLRTALDGRRRTLLLGLAAVVLALGAYQAFLAGKSAPSDDTNALDARPAAGTAAPSDAPATRNAESRAENKAEPSPAAPAPAPAQASAAPAPADATAPSGAPASVADPATTQSLAEPRAAKRGLPPVAGMAALGTDLAGLPPALAKLKQDALDGDGAAVWEIASRQAEGRGVTRDLAVAAKFYEKLALAGYAPAQFKVGNAYEKGSGLTRDVEKAKLWYGRAADQGNVRAMHNLAVLHAENPAANGKPDFTNAANAFRRAAEHGVRDSQYNLAVLYARGLGVGQDLVQSYLWFSAAAGQGDQEAGRKRDEVATKLSPKDLGEAKALAAGFRAKTADPAANEAPSPKATAAAPMSLMGAPSPGMPNSAFQSSAQKRVGV